MNALGVGLDPNLIASSAAATAVFIEAIKRIAPKMIDGKEPLAAVWLPLAFGVVASLLGVSPFVGTPYSTTDIAANLLAGSVGAKMLHDGLSPALNPIVDKLTGKTPNAPTQ